MNNKILLRVLGAVATIGGAALALLSDWVSNENMKEETREYIDAKFTELNSEDTEES